MMRGSVFIVPHTHWDREWYEPATRFRQRLVAVLDRALRLLESGRLPVFLLDGQTVLIRDYLDVRPEERGRILRLAGTGKLLLGPWYVLADELLTSDETLVRNLLIGKRDAGRGWLPVGYSPDAFGHPAALPVILAGFGIHRAIVWRGYGGEVGQEPDLFRWTGPDGSAVLVHHLPPAGYELGAHLPRDRASAKQRWRQIRAQLEARAQGRPLLLLCGADHHEPQADLTAALAALSRAAAPRVLRAASPLHYFAALPADVRASEVEGELRFSYRHAWTLQGVHATRAPLKALIRAGERLLVRWAEPQAALAWAAGAADRRPLIGAAWREHLLNCFHDTLAGTTADEVAREAEVRARNVIAQARGVLDDALHDRLGQDRSRARRNERRWTPTLVVVNPSAHNRSGVVEATILAAAGAPAVLGAAGAPVPLQLLETFEAYDRLDAPDAYPRQDRVQAWRVALWAGDVPALGMRTYRVGGTAARRHGGRREMPDAGWVRVRAGGIQTRSWRVRPGRRGFRVEARDRGLLLHGVGEIVSERDDGDLYTFQPVDGDVPVTARWGKAKPLWRGPLVGALGRPFDVPGRARGAVYARLDAGAKLVRVVVEGENLTGGHRLRIRFPLPASRHDADALPARVSRPTAHLADMHYGAVFRQREAYDLREFPREWPVHTAPMHRYVTVPGGLTLLSRDSYEYEIAPGAILVTLFRSVDQLSKGNLAARPGHAAWPAATPEARELGPFRAEFAVTLATPPLAAAISPGGPALPRSARRWSEVEAAAEEFHAPLGARMLRYAVDAPAVLRGVRLEGEALVLKAVKPAERGRALVLRCVNVAPEVARGAWVCAFAIRRAHRARLDETPLEPLPVARGGRRVEFEAQPREVVTVLVEPGRRRREDRLA